VDRNQLAGTVDFLGSPNQPVSQSEGAAILAARESHPGLAPHPDLPDDTRLWAALQAVGGGTWGGCVYDLNAITERLRVHRGGELGHALTLRQAGRLKAGGSHSAG
jgi:hypothetical protein